MRSDVYEELFVERIKKAVADTRRLWPNVSLKFVVECIRRACPTECVGRVCERMCKKSLYTNV